MKLKLLIIQCFTFLSLDQILQFNMDMGIFAMFKMFKLLHDDRIYYCMLNVLDSVLITIL